MPLDNRLKDNIDEKLENLEAELDGETIEEPEDQSDEIDEDLESEDTDNIEEGQEDPEDGEPEQKKETPKDPDYENKFKESTREAQVLALKNKKFAETIEQASQITDIDEAELLKEYPDWNELSVTQKKMAKENLINTKRFEMINSTVKDGQKADEWAGNVDTFLDDDVKMADFPALNGRESDFRAFCMKPTRRGLDIEDLASAFLYQKPMAAQKNKGGSLLLSGGNSTEHKPASTKISAEGAAALRKRSPTAYMRAVREGKIDADA